MGLLNLLEEVAGAVAAVEVVKKLDPNAGLLEEGIAAIAGFEGMAKIQELLTEDKKDGTA